MSQEPVFVAAQAYTRIARVTGRTTTCLSDGEHNRIVLLNPMGLGRPACDIGVQPVLTPS